MHPTITLDIYNPQFWVAGGQIIIIDLLLSGDNAMVIAMACRQLPEKQKVRGAMGSGRGSWFARDINNLCSQFTFSSLFEAFWRPSFDLDWYKVGIGDQKSKIS